jgi:hypothetical protein
MRGAQTEMSKDDFTKIILPEDKIPKFWYNVQADMPTPLSPGLHPGTKQPLGPDDLAPLFAMNLIAQEVSTERYIEIPPITAPGIVSTKAETFPSKDNPMVITAATTSIRLEKFLVIAMVERFSP